MNSFFQTFQQITQKYHFWAVAAFVITSPLLCSFCQPGGADLKITFEGLLQKHGTIRLALYRSENEFMDECKAALINIPVDETPAQMFWLRNLPPGNYALAFFHDENDNFKLDKNILGIPTEPYGFSKMPSSKWRVPEFNEVAIEINSGNNEVVVQLKKW